MSFVRSLILAAAVTGAAAPLAAQSADKPAGPATLTSADSARYLEIGKSATRWMLAGHADSLATALDPEALEKAGGVNGLKAMHDQMQERIGPQTRLVQQKLTRRNGMVQFWHEAEFTNFTDEAVVIRWVMNDKMKIVGVGMNPLSKAPPVD